MTSPSPPEINLPVIKFTEDCLKPKTSSWASTREQVVRELENHGCFMAKYEKLSTFHEELFNALNVIFDLRVETKEQNVSDIPDFTYRQDHPVLRRFYESFGIPEATTKEGTQKFITSLWPRGNDVTRKAILAYTRTAAVLEEMVRKIVFEHYQLPNKESTGYIFRMMKYRDEVRLGCSDHANRMELLAVLDLNQVNGLEMKTKGGKWSRIDVRPSTFLIMAGKPLMDWSEGKIHPREHRVMMHGNEARYSVGLFSYYDKGKIEVPKEQVGSSSRS